MRVDERSIFLIDGLGAVTSAATTGLVLPLFSPWTGIPASLLHILALFPVVYATYSLSCFGIVKKIQRWMLRSIIAANLIYCVICSALVFTQSNLLIWGRLYLIAEIFVILVIVSIEIKTDRRFF